MERRTRTSTRTKTRRDPAVDLIAMDYGLDSYDVDQIEADCLARGVSLVTAADWIIQFDLARTARKAMR